MSEFDEARLAAFIDRLTDTGRVKVPIDSVWDAFNEVFPDRPANSARATLADLLQHAAASGALTLPKTQAAWDRALKPPLPKFILFPAEDLPAPPKRWKERAWHPLLEWVTGLAYLTTGQEAFLSRVNEGLVHGWFDEVAPMKYRSLQLTGHEKKLQSTQATKLFGPGRLTLDLLGCEPDVHPMVVHSVGTSRAVLIMENAGAFHVARRVLSKMDQAPYGAVAFGGGNRLPNSLPALKDLDTAAEAVHYLGDLDWEGLAIAARGRKVCADVGLPPLVPPPGLHEAMLESAATFGSPRGWEGGRSAEEGEKLPLLEHVPPAVRSTAEAIVTAGRRVPEEVLGPREFSRALQALRP